MAKKKAKSRQSQAKSSSASARLKAKTGKQGRARARGKKASSEKRKSLPLSSSALAARGARKVVWEISSEKTQEVILSQAQADEMLQETAQAQVEQAGVSAKHRRSSRDIFGFLREELGRACDPQDPQVLWRVQAGRQRHELRPGVTPEALSEFEERVGLELPRSCWDFFLNWNGGELFVRQELSYRLLGVEEILPEIKGALCNTMVRPFLPLVVLGCGDYLALDMSKANKSGERPLTWWYKGVAQKKVAESLLQWLKKLVEARGEPYWWGP